MKRTPTKFRQSDVTRAVRAAVKAGIEIGAVQILTDGRISIVPAKAVAQADDLDRELAEFEGRHHGQH